jgi:hypothetical protein
MHLPFVLIALGGLVVAQSPLSRQAPQLAPALDATGEPQAAAVELAAPALPARTPRVHFDQPQADGPLWAGADAWKASFDGTGCTVIPFFGSDAPQNFPLRIELASITVGDDALALPGGTPRRDGNRVRTARGSVDEVIDTSVSGLEQSWVFSTLPNRGAITVDLRLQGDYQVTPTDVGLRFANAYGRFDYHGAVAVDADGRRLPLSIGWDGDSAQLTIPAPFVAEAKLPLVLDPVLNGWFQLGSAAPAGQTQRDSDVASFQALGGRTLMVWTRQWSAVDADCWALLFDGNLGLVKTDFTLDFTSEDWLKVACAANNHARNFLVVSEVRIGIQHSIFGRVVSDNGTPGGVITIERDGVVGTPGNNFHPDVGGDPSFAPGRYTVVFHKRYLFDSEIFMRGVSPSGSLLTTNAIKLTPVDQECTRPAISKSCGQANGNQQWLVTFQRTWTVPYSTDQDLWGRFVQWNGAVPTAPFAIAYSSGEETMGSPSSPIDSGGQRLWPVVHSWAGNTTLPRDLTCHLMRADGTPQDSANIGTGIPGVDHADAEVDSDGTRFVVAYTRGGTREEVITIAHLPATFQLRIESRTGLQTSSTDARAQCNVVADRSGGTGTSPRYFISFTNLTSNSFHLVNFGGYTGGTTLFTSRDSFCSNQLPISVTGSPVIGQTVFVSVDNGSPLAASIFGFQDSISLGLLGCGCLQGVALGAVYGPASFNWTVPNNPTFVGTGLAVQGFALGNECLGMFNLSDIVDFTLR